MLKNEEVLKIVEHPKFILVLQLEISPNDKADGHSTSALSEMELFMKNYMSIFKKHKGKLLMLSCTIIVTSVLYIGITYIGGIYIDIISAATTINTINLVCFFLILLSMVSLVTKYILSYIMNSILEDIVFDFKYYILRHLKRISILEYKKFNIAYLSKRIEEDSRQISQFFVNNYTTAFVKVLEVIIIMIIVLRINFIIGLVMFTLSPIYYITYKKFKNPIFEKNLVAKEKSAEFFQNYSYHLEYLEDIIIEADFERENDLLRKKYVTYYEKFKEFISINNKFTIVQGMIVAFMQITIYLIGGISVFYGYTTVGRLSILISYFLHILGNITYYNELLRTYQLTKTSIHRIDELINIPFVKEGTKKLDTITSIKAKIFYSIDNHQILNNVDIDVTRGEVIGIIGKNGTGKTTLLKLLIGSLKLNKDDYQSSIIFNEQYNIQDLDTMHLRKEFLAYTSQRIRFRDISMKEVFNEIGNYEIYSDFISELQENNVPLTKEIEKFIEDNWVVKMDNLSGGDKQIVAILRNIVRRSSILFFDEPTSNLDVSRVEWFVEMIYSVKRNKITFIITHDNQIDMVFDKVINLAICHT